MPEILFSQNPLGLMEVRKLIFHIHMFANKLLHEVYLGIFD